MKQEILEAIKNNNDYDFISNNFYKLTETEKKQVLLEYIYIFYKAYNEMNEIDALHASMLKDALIENIKEYL